MSLAKELIESIQGVSPSGRPPDKQYMHTREGSEEEDFWSAKIQSLAVELEHKMPELKTDKHKSLVQYIFRNQGRMMSPAQKIASAYLLYDDVDVDFIMEQGLSAGQANKVLRLLEPWRKEQFSAPKDVKQVLRHPPLIPPMR